MVGRRKRRIKKEIDPTLAEKKKVIEKLWQNFRQDAESYRAHLKACCDRECDRIKKMYDDKITAMPAHLRKMTIAEIIALQEKENSYNPVASKQETAYREQLKLISEKKALKTKERNRSFSASCSRPLPNINVGQSTNIFSRLSRIQSETSLLTPVSKYSRLPSIVVTPKFDPKKPTLKGVVRKPRVGEVLMSLTGSPVHNYMDDIPDKPTITLSLGKGKVVMLSDTNDVDIEKELPKENVEPLKLQLENVKKKLDKVIQKSN
ncbi:uncharacterized protein LOC118205157 [Stegodyphus dumicola]|uniref:uncharacterized protein LOC118205157 n=1 Tax=Stegodyphus dumicola TaxID=202533 RepID=UPI0015B29753|nr:uncharacterized protein LOC118205157 [Stegodyphus dumicola]